MAGLLRALIWLYRPIIEAVLRHKVITLAAAILILGASVSGNQASSATLNAYFTFGSFGSDISYIGGIDLSTATSVTFPTPEYAFFIPANNPVDGHPNDFGATGHGWSFKSGSSVTLNPTTLSTSDSFPNITSFLTFANTQRESADAAR